MQTAPHRRISRYIQNRAAVVTLGLKAYASTTTLRPFPRPCVCVQPCVHVIWWKIEFPIRHDDTHSLVWRCADAKRESIYKKNKLVRAGPEWLWRANLLPLAQQKCVLESISGRCTRQFRYCARPGDGWENSDDDNGDEDESNLWNGIICLERDDGSRHNLYRIYTPYKVIYTNMRLCGVDALNFY